jgi:hypothetical protein
MLRELSSSFVAFSLCMAAAPAIAAGLTFDSVSNGFWTVTGPAEAYAWNDPGRRRPQAGDSVRIRGHEIGIRQNEAVGQFEFFGGSLAMGGFALGLQDNSRWLAGTIQGRITNSAVWIWTGSGAKRWSGVGFNAGTVQIESETSVALERGSSLTNLPGSLLELNGTARVSHADAGSGAWPVLAVSGELRKSGGGTAVLGAGLLLQNHGEVRILEGALHCEMPYVQSTGSTHLAGTRLSTVTSISLLGGELNGFGTLTGSVVNAAVLRPDAGSAGLRIEGAYAQSRAGTLAIRLAGSPGSDEYSRLLVRDLINLRGTLKVELSDGFVPQLGERYPVLRGGLRAGRFTTTNLAEVAGMRLEPEYRADGVDVVVRAVGP